MSFSALCLFLLCLACAFFGMDHARFDVFDFFQGNKVWSMRLRKHWKKLKHSRRFSTWFNFFFFFDMMLRAFFVLYDTILKFIYILTQLPVLRQEPVLDSSKYTAADVRIVSDLSSLILSAPPSGEYGNLITWHFCSSIFYFWADKLKSSCNPCYEFDKPCQN